MLVIFNKDKKFVGYADDEFPDMPHLELLTLRIPDEQSDLTKWWWEGDMFNGKMVKIKP
jgi:hypothetical protein